MSRDVHLQAKIGLTCFHHNVYEPAEVRVLCEKVALANDRVGSETNWLSCAETCPDITTGLVCACRRAFG